MARKIGEIVSSEPRGNEELMTRIPTDRFVQICCGARQYNTQDRDSTELFALDEGGGVWRYIVEHSVWIPLNRDRAVMEPVKAT